MPSTPPSFAPLTGSLVTFAQGVQAKLQAAVATLGYGGNPATIYYGEQARYPTVPSYCVEPVVKRRDTENQKLQRVFDIYFTAQVIGYLVQVNKSEQVVRQDVDKLGEVAEAILNADHTLGGLTIDFVVTHLESGYAYKEDTKYKAVILTVEGRSREGLPC